MRQGSIFVALATVIVASAAAVAAVPVPLPPERPPELGAATGSPHAGDRPASGGSQAIVTGAVAPVIPLPPERPKDIDRNRIVRPAIVEPPSEPDDPGCPDRLARMGVVAKPLPAIANGACGTPRPLEVSRLPDGVEVVPAVTLSCPATEALAKWSRDAVSAAADSELGTAPKRIAIGTSYQCRNQNHQVSAKLSEHAFANAVDISGFEFVKRPSITVGKTDAATPEGRFLDKIRTAACTYFTTVLGPGSDAEHADHLHLDIRQRSRGFRLCQ